MSKVKFGNIAREHKETLKNDKSNMAIVGLEHLIPGNIKLINCDYNKSNTFKKVFRKGNVLFGRRRAYLKKAAYAEFDGICSGDITVIEAIPGKISPSLLPFVVQNDRFFDYAVGKSAGSLSPRVKWEDLKEYEFELPDTIEEQEKIAELLWSMVDTNDKYKELIIKTDELVKSQFIELINVKGGTISGKLGDYLQFMEKSKIKAGEGLGKGSYPLFNSSTELTKWYNDYLFDDECIILPTGGKAAVHYFKGKFASTTDNFVCKGNGKILTKYIYLFLKNNIDILQNGFKGSGLQHISKEYIKEMQIIAPELKDQRTIIKFADQSDKSKFELEKCLEELEKTYKRIIFENLG